MKRKKVALYDPYLDTMGGGEKHILSILQVLQEEGYEVTIFWNTDLSNKINAILNLQFKEPLKFIPNIFISQSFLQKTNATGAYDIFLYVTDGSYFFSSAKQNYVFAMVPLQNLYKLTLINKIKLHNYMFVSNSQFTQQHLRKWGIHATVLYPYLDQNFLEIDSETLPKEKIILSVGRFFKHLHSKRHDIAIQTFKKLKQKGNLLADYQLVIAGGLNSSDQGYFDELTYLIDNDPSITLKPNISYNDLLTLYKKSEMYWHFAGYGIDEDKNPEAVEHLGITPLEAMAAGCITFSYRAGGPKEIIQDGVTGFLFSNELDLQDKLTNVLSSKNKRSDIIGQARQYVKQTFDYSVFKHHVKKIFLHNK